MFQIRYISFTHSEQRVERSIVLRKTLTKKAVVCGNRLRAVYEVLQTNMVWQIKFFCRNIVSHNSLWFAFLRWTRGVSVWKAAALMRWSWQRLDWKNFVDFQNPYYLGGVDWDLPLFLFSFREILDHSLYSLKRESREERVCRKTGMVCWRVGVRKANRRVQTFSIRGF